MKRNETRPLYEILLHETKKSNYFDLSTTSNDIKVNGYEGANSSLIRLTLRAFAAAGSKLGFRPIWHPQRPGLPSKMGMNLVFEVEPGSNRPSYRPGFQKIDSA
jgi:hypothetical protein